MEFELYTNTRKRREKTTFLMTALEKFSVYYIIIIIIIIIIINIIIIIIKLSISDVGSDPGCVSPQLTKIITSV